MKHAIASALVLLTLFATEAGARPAYRRALADLLALPAASKLNDCRVCHLPLKQGADENDRPHNAFGKRLKAVRSELRKANKPSNVVSRVLAVADEDADGDGVSNLLELLAGTFPGEADSKPSAAELAAAKKRLPRLLASLTGYRWRPFDRVERPPLPAIKYVAGVRNPIDVFLTAEMEKHDLKPRPPAPKHVLLRRVTVDLTGLPPTPQELRDFLADDFPDAYEKVVDRLLSSPRYGERWGRRWMDVWRYSDWAGFGAQVRDSLPHVWRWRDWIVESLNAGKGYDRMVQEMLAADELSPTDPDALRTTGFLVRNYKLLSREKWLQDAVDHTSQAFLGATLGCARCHDHQYDPFTTKEYYQVRAIFTPHNVRTDRVPGSPDVTKNGLPRAYDADLSAPAYLLVRGDDRTPDKSAPLAPGVPEALGGTFEVKPVSLPRDAYEPDRRTFVIEETLAAARADLKAKQAEVVGPQSRRREVLRTLMPDPHPLRAAASLASAEPSVSVLTRAALAAEVSAARLEALEAVLKAEALEPAGPKPSNAYVAAAKAASQAQRRQGLAEARQRLWLMRWLNTPARRKAKEVAAAEQALAKAEAASKAPETTSYVRRPVKTYPATSTGRRLAFAKWIANRDNPLAARVAVNHVWLRHFGAALAPGVFDLGRNAQQPTHPALLDWLAVEFMERGWSLKALHRLILTSAAYRRHSTPDRDNLARDPDNVYLWRFAPRRAEAEVVRDGILFVAGRLDETRGGPDLPYSQGLTVNRRSIYFQHAQEKQVEFLLLFDTAAVTECYQRRQAIMPQQALALNNSELALRHARLTARALNGAGGSDEKFVGRAFEKVLSRAPTAAETATCLEFLKGQTRRFAAPKLSRPPLDRDGATPAAEPELRARENLVHVLFNHHEFVTIR